MANVASWQTDGPVRMLAYMWSIARGTLAYQATAIPNEGEASKSMSDMNKRNLVYFEILPCVDCMPAWKSGSRSIIDACCLLASNKMAVTTAALLLLIQPRW